MQDFPEHKRTLAELAAEYTTSDEAEGPLMLLHAQATQSNLSAAEHMEMLTSIRSGKPSFAKEGDREEAMAVAFVDGRSGRVIRLPHETLLGPGEFKTRLEAARRAARQGRAPERRT
ncbi:hypothetical protein L1785_22650 [Antribacter sp. KLBMP9083]|uniref:Uncharacterized protein n=1 Tax=Antribacter soli TaxID=2910976 RepID=A0AA41QKK2_9MICO|nr:hypothetical protein [Antribacter soli]MCF4123759.1 hypothetical protein [Antribacter soli]